MGDLLGNTITFLTGAVGGAIGFVLIGFIIVVLFVPLIFFIKNRGPARRSGLSDFSASLDRPDEGYDDRMPTKTNVRRSDRRVRQYDSP